MSAYVSPTGSLVQPSRKTGAPRKGALDLSRIIAKPGAIRTEVAAFRRSIEEQASMSERALFRAGRVADALESAGMDRSLAEDAALARIRTRVSIGKGDHALSVAPSSTLGRALLALAGKIEG